MTLFVRKTDKVCKERRCDYHEQVACLEHLLQMSEEGCPPPPPQPWLLTFFTPYSSSSSTFSSHLLPHPPSPPPLVHPVSQNLLGKSSDPKISTEAHFSWQKSAKTYRGTYSFKLLPGLSCRDSTCKGLEGLRAPWYWWCCCSGMGLGDWPRWW